MRCDGCGLCIGVCRRQNLVLIDGVVGFVETVVCEWCTLCEAVCENGAISCPFEIVFG
ncbi:ferredoxin [Chloroflexota bacterium]